MGLSKRHPLASDDHDFVEAVEIDRVRMLFKEAGHTMLASLIAGAVWCGANWNLTHASRVLPIWYGLLLLAVAMRWRVLYLYRRDRDTGAGILRWYTPYFFAVMLSTLVWSVGTTWIVWHATLEARLVTLVFLISVSGAGLVAYGWFPRLALGVILVTLTPALLLFLRTDDAVAGWMAAGVVWFLASALRTTYAYGRRARESFLQTHHLREANRIAQWHAETDALTGLKNRRAFTAAAEALVELARRERHPVSVMVIDLDRFKAINDDHGHSIGDLMLQRAAKAMIDSVRRSDVCGRLGGDEFAVVLPNTDEDAAHGVAGKLLARMAASTLQVGEREVPIQLSIGIACGHGDEDFAALLARADRDMYRVKRHGRLASHLRTDEPRTLHADG